MTVNAAPTIVRDDLLACTDWQARWCEIVDDLTRRQLFAASGAVALGVAGCAGGNDQGESTGEWTFTDDIGTVITRDEPPQRIVAFVDVAAALADMGLADRIVGVFGGTGTTDPKFALQSPNLDLTQFENLSHAEYGEINTEELLRLEPDLVVTTSYGVPKYWFINDEPAKQIEAVVPIAAISVDGTTLPELLRSSERLASALGADEGDLAEGQDALKAATERAQRVVEAAGDPRILAAAAGTTERIYIANPDGRPVFSYLKTELGVDMITPAAEDIEEGDFWQHLSYERADAYPDAEVVMIDARNYDASRANLSKNELWAKLPAAQNDAYIPWRVEVAPSSRGYATWLEQFADDLEAVTT